MVEFQFINKNKQDILKDIDYWEWNKQNLR